MTTDIRIRAARREDAEAIGRGVVMALHDEIALDFAGSADRLPLVYKVFTTLAAADNSQYSYRNCRRGHCRNPHRLRWRRTPPAQRRFYPRGKLYSRHGICGGGDGRRDI